MPTIDKIRLTLHTIPIRKFMQKVGLVMTMTEEKLLTIEETAVLLRLSKDTIRRMIRDKQLDATKVRGSWRVKVSSVNKYL